MDSLNRAFKFDIESFCWLDWIKEDCWALTEVYTLLGTILVQFCNTVSWNSAHTVIISSLSLSILPVSNMERVISCLWLLAFLNLLECSGVGARSSFLVLGLDAACGLPSNDHRPVIWILPLLPLRSLFFQSFPLLCSCWVTGQESQQVLAKRKFT